MLLRAASSSLETGPVMTTGSVSAFSGFQHAMPFSKVPETVAEMVHRVHAHHHIERVLLKRQRLVHICKLESGIRELGIPRLFICGFDPLFIDIQPRDPTIKLFSKVKCRSS